MERWTAPSLGIGSPRLYTIFQMHRGNVNAVFLQLSLRVSSRAHTPILLMLEKAWGGGALSWQIHYQLNMSLSTSS